MRDYVQTHRAKCKNILLMLLLQFFTVSLFAQTTISGKVTDADNKGVADISVVVRTTNFGGTTDANGNYSIQTTLKSGTYQLEFSGVGFKAATQTIQVNSSGSVSVNMQLGVDALKMDEVVVIGSSLSQSRKQLGNTVN